MTAPAASPVPPASRPLSPIELSVLDGMSPLDRRRWLARRFQREDEWARQDALRDYLREYLWEWFGHLTFQSCQSLDYAKSSARRYFNLLSRRAWGRNYHKRPDEGLFAFVAFERQKRGDWHAHFVAGGTRGLKTLDAMDAWYRPTPRKPDAKAKAPRRGRKPSWKRRVSLRRADATPANCCGFARIFVAGRDVMWSLDATHLGRGPAGREVQGQALRDVATPRTLALSVGGAATTAGALLIMATAQRARGGGLPLVLVTDNGAPYVSERFERHLAEHGVVHLRSLPHTPQHNPWVERGHRDLKDESGLGKSVVMHSHADAARRLADALERIDGHRLRATLGYRTARAVDRELPVPYDDSVRERLVAMVARRAEEGLHDQMNKRDRRVLRREAVLASLEELGMIERTRGGRPLRAVKEDSFS